MQSLLNIQVLLEWIAIWPTFAAKIKTITKQIQNKAHNYYEKDSLSYSIDFWPAVISCSQCTAG